MPNHSTKSITIYQKTYRLPVLEDNSFQQIQSQIKQRQQVIKNQKRVIRKRRNIQKKSLFGLISNPETIEETITQQLTFEDQFHELERLVKDYNQLISFLSEHKEVYLQFFAQLTSDLKQVVNEKLKEASQQEKERLQLLAEQTDNELISILSAQKEQILGNVWLFGKAFLLMLKKIDLMSEGIEKITTDQDAQRQLLVEMVEKLGKYKKVYALQRKINQSGKEAEKMANTAVNFEQYLQPFIGSFQGLIDRVCEQDSSLDGTVNEIKSLVEDIMSSNTGSFVSAGGDDLSKNMLDFLITNEQKKERLVTAVEDAQQQGINWSWQQIDIQDCGDLTQAISALQSHIDGKLGEYSQDISYRTSHHALRYTVSLTDTTINNIWKGIISRIEFRLNDNGEYLIIKGDRGTDYLFLNPDSRITPPAILLWRKAKLFSVKGNKNTKNFQVKSHSSAKVVKLENGWVLTESGEITFA